MAAVNSQDEDVFVLAYINIVFDTALRVQWWRNTLCSKKLDHQTHGGITLSNLKPIFKILSLLDSVINLQQNNSERSHHTFNALLPNLVKHVFKKSSCSRTAWTNCHTVHARFSDWKLLSKNIHLMMRAICNSLTRRCRDPCSNSQNNWLYSRLIHGSLCHSKILSHIINIQPQSLMMLVGKSK